jgi:DNA-binding CsgD family transcriptional regulator
MKTEVALSILDSIYAAGTLPERWPVALGKLAHVFNCSCVSLVDKNTLTSKGSAFSWGIDAAGEREYMDYWLPRNIFHLRTRVWRPGQVETDRTILPKSELLRSDYYNGFLKPFEMHAMLRVALSAGETSVHLLALARAQSAGEYERSDIDALQPLVGHLQRAATISKHMNEVGEALHGLSGVLEHGSTGIILLSAAGRVVFANSTASKILETGFALGLRASRLIARSRRDDVILRRLIAGATGQIKEVGDARGGALCTETEAGMPGLTVVVGPLDSSRVTSQTSPAAFVLLTDPDRGSSRPAWMLQTLYELTPAEILMAERLMKGDTPKQAAAALNIKVSTARWHLSALFEKTGTARQSELVRLLLSLPNI